MALDKLVDSAQLDANLTSIANAIRAKTGSTATLAFPSDFVNEITAIQTGGNYIAKTVIPNDTIQIISKNTDLDMIIRSQSAASVSPSTNGGSSGALTNGLLSYALTLDHEYGIIGQIYVIDANDNILECYNVNTTFIWNNTTQIIVQNDTNAYYNKFSISRYSSSSTRFLFTCYYQKTGVYGYRTELSIGEPTNYDALSMVTVNAEIYPDALIKKWIQRQSFNNIEWPDGLTEIGSYAFSNCNNFNTSSLPSTITSINSYAFQGCSNLTLTSLPSSVTTIETGAFSNCNNLALTSLPSSITIINAYSFSGCYKLALTSLPSGVTKINANAFASCHLLALTSLPAGLTEIGDYAFQYCRSLSISTLPNTITKIGSYAFYECINITSISCNGVITTLSGYSFCGSTSYPMQIRSISFPYMTASSVINCFGYNSNMSAKLLEFVDLGSTAAISGSTFAYCYALETLVLRRSNAICTLNSSNAFINSPMTGYNNMTGTIYVPSALIASYRTATNWSTLYNNGTVNFVAIEGSAYEL